MNTARAFGPAVVTGFPYPSQWVVSINIIHGRAPELCSLVVLGRTLPRLSAGVCFLRHAKMVSKIDALAQIY
jgi:hypothetical protein